MDVDIVLNSCLETYQLKEIERVKTARQIIEESRTTKLFKNGKFFADIVELTMDQNVTTTPIYMLGSTAPVARIPSRPSIQGRFIMNLTSGQNRELNPAFVIEVPSYYIEMRRIFSDESASSIRIVDLMITQEANASWIPSNRVTYTYRGSMVEHLTSKEN